MEYTKGSPGRIFILRFDGGDEFLPKLEKFVLREKIAVAYFHILGALKDSEIVVGSKMIGGKNVPRWAFNRGEWEVMGFGTVLRQDGKPKIHLHVAAGRGKKSLLGCLRKKQKVYLTIECVVVEIKNAKVRKAVDKSTGLSLIKFK